MNALWSESAGRTDASTAALLATNGRRAHHTCSRFGAGNGVAAEGAYGNMGAMPFAVLAVAVGNQIATYLSIQVSLQIFNFLAGRLIGGGIALAADGVIAGVIGAFLGPIAIAAGAILVIVDVAGPSIRATAPAVFQIALMRQTFLWEDALA